MRARCTASDSLSAEWIESAVPNAPSPREIAAGYRADEIPKKFSLRKVPAPSTFAPLNQGS